MTWWGVVNPAAGRGGHSLDRIRDVLAAAGVEASLHPTASEEDLRAQVRSAASDGEDRFLAIGGDGTVNAMVDELLIAGVERPHIGVIPAGSGCDLLRTFAIPQTMEGAAKHLTGDEFYDLDVGRLAGAWGSRHFVNVATAGLGGATVRYAARLPARLGAMRYKLAIWPALATTPRRHIELEAGKRSYRGPATLVVFANAQFFGGGMNVAPRAAAMDGQLDIQVFTGPKWQALTLQPRVARGTHLRHRGVRRLESGAFALDGDLAVEADGEYLGHGKRLVGSVLSKAIALKI